MKDTRLIWKVTFLYTSNEQVAFEIKNTLSFTLEPPKCEILRYKSRKDVQKQMRKNYKTLMKDFKKDWLILSRCSAFPIWPVNSTSVSSVAQSCPTLCDPMNCSTPGLPVHHQLLELTQTHVHRVSDAIQPSNPLLSPSPPAPNPFQHQGLFQWVNSSHEVAKVLEFQPQHQSFQWAPRTDLL